MFLSLREGPQGTLDFTDALEPAISAALPHADEVGAWVNAIRIASDVGVADEVLYDLMRTGVRKAGHRVIDDVIAARTPPMLAEHVALLDRAAQDLADEKHAEGFVLRVPGEGGRMVEFEFAPPERGLDVE